MFARFHFSLPCSTKFLEAGAGGGVLPAALPFEKNTTHLAKTKPSQDVRPAIGGDWVRGRDEIIAPNFRKRLQQRGLEDVISRKNKIIRFHPKRASDSAQFQRNYALNQSQMLLVIVSMRSRFRIALLGQTTLKIPDGNITRKSVGMQLP